MREEPHPKREEGRQGLVCCSLIGRGGGGGGGAKARVPEIKQR